MKTKKNTNISLMDNLNLNIIAQKYVDAHLRKLAAERFVEDCTNNFGAATENLKKVLGVSSTVVLPSGFSVHRNDNTFIIKKL